jgi:hypothetical protein
MFFLTVDLLRKRYEITERSVVPSEIWSLKSQPRILGILQHNIIKESISLYVDVRTAAFSG